MSKTRRKPNTTATDVLEALRAKAFREPAHAWLREVRNQTGYGRRQRYADALVVSVWPSRGIWFGGIEVKVSRSDWLKELDQPEKSAEIQRFCDFWWIAAPEGIVQAQEVPERWGYYCVDGSKSKCVREAPRLTPEPLSREFVASVLRNESDGRRRLYQEGYGVGYANAAKSFDADAKNAIEEELADKSRQLRRAEQSLEYTKRDLEALRKHVAVFERSAGLHDGAISSNFSRTIRFDGAANVGEAFKAALAMQQVDTDSMAARLETIAEALRKVRVEHVTACGGSDPETEGGRR